MQVIAARKFGLEARSDLDPSVVDKMLYLLRRQMPDIMEKNDAGHWTFAKSSVPAVESFLNDPGNVATAEADTRSMAMFSSGRSRGRKEATIRLRLSTGEICDLSTPEAEKALFDMSCEIHRLTVKVELLERSNGVVQPQGTVIPFPFARSANQLSKPAPVKRTPEKAKAEKQAAISKMAYFIATNLTIALTARTLLQAQDCYAAEANKLSLRSPSCLVCSYYCTVPVLRGDTELSGCSVRRKLSE